MQKGTISLFSLAKIFLTIGSTSFGGWSVAYGIIEKILVEERKLITKKELSQAISYSQMLPGSTVTGMVSNIGYRLHGWPGSVVATVCYLFPSVAGMAVLAALYFSDLISPEIKQQMKGAYAALVGIILANALKFGQDYNKTTWMWLLSGAVLVAHIFYHLNPAILVLSCGVIGALFFTRVEHDK